MFINEVTLHGNLTKDPELKALPSGINVCNFSVATNRKWKNKDNEMEESVEFHNCVAFGKTGENIAKYHNKGDAIYVRGRLQTRSWDKDGEKRYSTEIVVERFEFARGNKKRDANGPDGRTAEEVAAPTAPDYPEEEINPEDIPF